MILRISVACAQKHGLWSFHLVPVILQEPFNLVYLLTLFFAQAFVFFDYISRPSSLLKALANFAGTKETKAMSDNALVKQEDEGTPEDTLQRHHSIKLTKPWPPRISDRALRATGSLNRRDIVLARWRISIDCGVRSNCFVCRGWRRHMGETLGRQREMKSGVWGCR
jgi:hypothetical protein